LIRQERQFIPLTSDRDQFAIAIMARAGRLERVAAKRSGWGANIAPHIDITKSKAASS